MSDLNAFFAKKANSKKKTHVTMNVGTLGQKLERNVQREEELERKEKEMGNKAGNEGEVDEDDDSEWIDPSASELTTNLEEFGIKEMGASEYAEEEESDDKKVEAEPVKTWGTINKKPENNSEDQETAEGVSASPKKYVAPGSRNAGSSRFGRNVKLDLNSDEAFPTLAAADAQVKTAAAENKAKSADADAGFQVIEKSGRYVPPNRRTDDVKPWKRREDVPSSKGSEDVKPWKRNEDVKPYKRSEDVKPNKQSEDVSPCKPSEDAPPKVEDSKPGKYIPPQKRNA